MKPPFLLLPALLLSTSLTHAAEKSLPVFMEADSMAYDKANNIVVAKGKVEVVRGGRVLLADMIYYYQKQDVVKAKGNVSLLQEDGNVLFADHLTLEPQMKKGVIDQFKARLSDNSAFAAAQAKRISPTEVELTKAVYSPCKLCDTDPTASPLWQIKSDNVHIDSKAESVEYKNAIFEVKGVPVAYTPYFAHPTPGASRKSGLLRPEYGRSSQLGTGIKLPYYIDIAPDKDATLTPWLITGDAPVALAEYRQRTDSGVFQFAGSATYPKARDNVTGAEISGNEFRGHLVATGRAKLNDDWNWGFDANRASDDTYLRRYRFSNADSLTSRAYAESINDRDYSAVESLTFQNLKSGSDSAKDPLILPNVTFHKETAPLALNGRVSLDGNAFALTRREGVDTRRLSTAVTYRLPYVTDGGHVLEAEAGGRVDAYNQNNLTRRDGSDYSGSDTRVVPQASLMWRYPLMTQVSDARLTVEPLAKVVTSTKGNNPDTIANEDSQTPEFNDYNLFDSNRYAGYDRIEEGTRAMAGVRTQLALSAGDSVSAMVGQEARLAGNNPFPVTSNPSNDLSDVVGQLGYDGKDVQLDYHTRVDADRGELRRNEVRGLYNFGRGTASADYTSINNDPVLADRKDITAGIGMQATETVGVNLFARRDMLRDAMVGAGAGAVINYDCVTLTTNLVREYTRDRDFQPDTSITFRIGLKNLD
jgi:LPS-assembly protein